MTRAFVLVVCTTSAQQKDDRLIIFFGKVDRVDQELRFPVTLGVVGRALCVVFCANTVSFGNSWDISFKGYVNFESIRTTHN